MSRTLSRYLKDFGAEPAPAAVMPSMAFDDMMDFAETVEAPVLLDIAAERRQAYAEGQEAATLSLTEVHQAELEAVNAAHQAELEELKAKFETESVARIAADLEQIAITIGLSVSTEAARALSPIMTEALTANAINELATLVTASIRDGAVGPITVSGRRALFDLLASKVDLDGRLLVLVEADDIDLCVTIDDSVLVTRMSAWADSLREVLS